MSLRINIAVGVYKEEKIWIGHFEIAPYINVYSFKEDLIEKRKNPYGA